MHFYRRVPKPGHAGAITQVGGDDWTGADYIVHREAWVGEPLYGRHRPIAPRLKLHGFRSALSPTCLPTPLLSTATAMRRNSTAITVVTL